MCLFFLQLIEVREEFFPSMDKTLLHRFYEMFDIKEVRNENYIVEELCKFLARR